MKYIECIRSGYCVPEMRFDHTSIGQCWSVSHQHNSTYSSFALLSYIRIVYISLFDTVEHSPFFLLFFFHIKTNEHNLFECVNKISYFWRSYLYLNFKNFFHFFFCSCSYRHLSLASVMWYDAIFISWLAIHKSSCVFR